MAYVVRRLLLVIPTLLGVSLLAFALANLAPGDPADQYLRRVLDRVPTTEEIREARHELGLDRPLVVQFVNWTWDAARGELGTSYASRRPVADEVIERAGFTLQLAIPAALLALLVALPVGTICAVYRSRPTDQVVRLTALAGASMPSFWLALLLILLFAVHLSLVPVAGRGGLSSYLLPVATLALEPAAVLSRFTRSTMLETLSEDYIRTARAKGLSRSLVVLRHALRNALIPVITYFGTRLGHLVTGAVIVETIFVWPGIGKLTVDAIATRDFPMLQGVVVFAGLTFAIINLLVDLSYAMIDPRIRLAAEPQR
ncbi:MAG: ABC transporter permease [Actinomycetota bacterium]|nr:ABC transporter permease [Actinomycetota bacterium]